MVIKQKLFSDDAHRILLYRALTCGEVYFTVQVYDQFLFTLQANETLMAVSSVGFKNNTSREILGIFKG